MKQLTDCICGILLFGAGILVGHYATLAKNKTVSTTAIQIPLPENNQATKLPVMPKSGIGNIPVPLPPSVSSPPLKYTAQEQAQIIAQQKEARQADIKQLEEFIKSLEENKFPAEEIKHFRELKKAMEAQSIQELPSQ